MTIQEFITKYNGRTLGVTGSQPGENDYGQCTAIVHAFERDNGLPIVYGDARDTYKNSMVGGTSSPYKQLAYTSGVIPPVPSVVVWNGTWGGGFGHTAVVTQADATGFYALSQNDPTDSKVAMKRYNYSSAITGFFYPKTNQGDDMASKEQLIELYKLAFPNQGVNYDWVKAFTGRDMSDALQNLRDDSSRQGFITELINDAASYRNSSTQPTKLAKGLYVVE
jgi:hypothetical protein